MNDFEVIRTQLTRLAGLTVAAKTVAGNTICIWFDADKQFGLSIDPPWRILAQGTIVATSADFPWEKEAGESDEAYRRRFDTACAYSDGVIGQTLLSATVDISTSDLRLSFAGGFELASFTVWRDEENWVLIDKRAAKRFWVSEGGVEVETIE